VQADGPSAYNPAMPSVPRALRLLACACLAGVLATAPVRAAETWPAPPERALSYRIQAALTEVPDEAGRERYRIVGSETIEWRNTSRDEVSVLYLHLYANAFRDEHSVMLSESAREGRKLPDEVEFGGIEVTDLSFSAGEPLELEFVPAPDGNRHDRTVARIVLPRAVLPTERATITLRFTTELPSMIRRMGQQEGFVMAAQWYPKLGRYVGLESDAPNLKEGWYCHHYHLATEFYADFADYEVELTTPTGLIVGATGEAIDEPVEAAGTRTTVYHAESVVDFAWTAHERFKRYVRMIKPADPSLVHDPVTRERARLQALLGLEPEDLDLPEVRVVLLLQPEHEDQLERHFEAARRALGLFGLWFGPYPYRKLTIVDPAYGAGAAGGMEYPMLVTAGTRIGARPEMQQPEGVIVHEIGHQWFMNLLASNEAEEAWLDEGVNTYFTGYFLDLCHGPAMRADWLLGRPVLGVRPFAFSGVSHAWPDWLGLPDWATPPDLDVFDAWRDLPWLTGVPALRYRDDFARKRRPGWVRQAGWDGAMQPGWEFASRRSYGANVYSRTALFMNTLRRRLAADLGPEAGERAFVRGLREYARAFRWQHPETEDLLAAIETTSGWDPRPHVAALMRTSALLDYGVESIRTFDEPAAPGSRAEAQERSEIVVRRRGEVVLPTPMTIEFTRDEKPGPDSIWERHTWDGRARWHRLVVDGRVTAARLDPEAVYLQDVDWTNQSRTAEPDRRPGVKWSVRFMVWLENALLSYGRFF